MKTRNIPHYPEFIDVCPDLLSNLSFYNKDYSDYCTFNATGLLNWNPPTNPTQLSILNNNLVVKTQATITKNFYYSFIGKNSVLETANVLLKDYKVLSLITEDIADTLKDKFQIGEDLINHNYIYLTKRIAKLDKALYRDKRKQIFKFFKLYDGFNIKKLDLSNKSTVKDVLRLTKLWEKQKMPSKDNYFEYPALSNYIKYHKYYKTIDIGFYLNGKLVAYTLNDISNPNMVDGMFGKGDHSIKYISTVYEYFTSQILYLEGYKYINLEMDSGIDGFRREKLSWRPVKILKMYTVTSKI